MQLAKAGKQVVMIERYEKIGGGCTHWGTIPSKALKFAIGGYTEAMNHPIISCLLYTSPSPRDQRGSRMPSSA